MIYICELKKLFVWTFERKDDRLFTGGLFSFISLSIFNIFTSFILNTFILFFEQSLLQLCEKNVTIPIEVNLGSRASYFITAAENCKKALKGNVNYNMAVSEFVHSLG